MFVHLFNIRHRTKEEVVQGVPTGWQLGSKGGSIQSEKTNLAIQGVGRQRGVLPDES